MDSLDQLRVFVRVAELGGFSRAAIELGLPKATVSTAVQQLEARLGVRVLHRTTRRVKLTPDGEQCYQRSKELLSDADELTSMFQRDPAALSGRIRIDMPTGLAKSLIIPLLPEFLSQYPQLNIELSSTDRQVDLIQEGFDCVIRIGTLADSGLIARPLGRMRLVNVASPKYIERYGRPQSLQDLAEHRLVHYQPALGGQPDKFEFWDGRQCHSVAMNGALTVNNAENYIQATLAGLGLIQAPWVGVRDLVHNGQLVEVLKDYPAEPMPVSLLYPHRRHLPMRVKLFMDWVANVVVDYMAD